MHSISELAQLAQNQLNQMNQQSQGNPAAQGQGYGGPGQQGQQGQGWSADPVPHSGPTPGWAADPVPNSGRFPGAGRRGSRNLSDGYSQDPLTDLGEGLAGLAMGAAAKFIGRAISQRVQRTVGDQVLPALAAKREEMLRTQLAIADRHPDLRACLTDNVVFLAGGNRVEPMPNLAGPFTIEQADQLVARLRNG